MDYGGWKPIHGLVPGEPEVRSLLQQEDTTEVRINLYYARLGIRLSVFSAKHSYFVIERAKQQFAHEKEQIALVFCKE